MRNGAQVGWLNSQTTSRPPGRVTRRISRSPAERVDDVAQPEGDRDGVEGVVGERQLGAVAGRERQVRPGLLADLEHAEGEVARHHGRAAVGERLARRAGAGREVEDPLPRPRVDGGDDRRRQRRSWPSESTSLVTS